MPHSARMYDAFLGGKDNFPADRAAVDRVLTVVPNIVVTARQNREFLVRAVRYLAERGIRQFLDVGTGIPTSPNTHEVAQVIDPAARVVYVDNDPIVLSHARALLTGTRQGRTAYIDADLRRPEAILADPALRRTLDLEQPVALLIIAVLHFLTDSDEPLKLVRRLLEALPAGSYLVVTHVTGDFAPEQWEQAVQIYRQSGITAQVRTRSEVAGFFAGLELEEPGLELVHRWRPEPEPEQLEDAAVSCYGAVARLPLA
jgi:hypothetical protein